MPVRNLMVGTPRVTCVRLQDETNDDTNPLDDEIYGVLTIIETTQEDDFINPVRSFGSDVIVKFSKSDKGPKELSPHGEWWNKDHQSNRKLILTFTLMEDDALFSNDVAAAAAGLAEAIATQAAELSGLPKAKAIIAEVDKFFETATKDDKIGSIRHICNLSKDKPFDIEIKKTMVGANAKYKVTLPVTLGPAA